MKTDINDIAIYLALPYTKILRRDEDGDVVARIAELPGCSTHGASEQEALQNLEEAQKLWIEDCIAAGETVPVPEKEEPLPSGKWVQRVPRTLHQKLTRMAKEEGVSLNQLVTSMLSQQLDYRSVNKALEQILLTHLSAGPSLHRQHYWERAVAFGAGGAWFVDENPPELLEFSHLKGLLPSMFEVKVNNELKTHKGFTTAGR